MRQRRLVRPLVATASICLALTAAPPGSAQGPAAPDASGANTTLYKSCGLNGLFVVLKHKNVDVSLKEVDQILRPDGEGFNTVDDLERAARHFGLRAASGHFDPNTLLRLPTPMIVQLKSRAVHTVASHYIVILSAAKDGLVVIDAPRPASYLRYDEFVKDWTGIAVVFPEDDAEMSRVLAEAQGIGRWMRWAPYIICYVAIAFITTLLVIARHRRKKTEALTPS